MRDDDLKYPSKEAVESVLTKLGIDPSSRFDQSDQDCEYTTCTVDELEDYINLYRKLDTSIYEKRVLGCYFLECLNEYIQENNSEHPLQNTAFELLYADLHIHETELAYWSDTSERDSENWWPISKPLVAWRRK